MALSRIFRSIIAATVLVASAPTFAQLTGPFYSCLSTPLADFDGSIVDAAAATPELSTLVTAVTTAGLGETLATAEGITVYAPTDDAFANLPSSILDTLLADTTLLTAVLTYHVTAEPAFRADPRRGSTAAPTLVDTLQGQTLAVGFNTGGAPMVNQSMADCQGVRTNNGVVWIIDSVLMPQFLPQS